MRPHAPGTQLLDAEDDPKTTRAAQLAQALSDTRDPLARRDFLRRMGAAIALAGAGAGGCTRAPREEIVPYVAQPQGVVVGRPSRYATASTLNGYATGLVVESHVGRPTKVEGNPIHPASLGASGVFEQASILSLYEPSRARGVEHRGVPTTWSRVQQALTTGRWTGDDGRGLHLLLEPTSSPTVLALLTEIQRRLPRVTVSFYAPCAPIGAWEGARIAFGRVLEPRFSLERADVIVALDSDFLTMGPASLRLARAFADRRDVQGPSDSMNRLYAVEAITTVTGAAADHRLRVRASEVLAIAAALAGEVGVPGLPHGVPPAFAASAAPHRDWISAVARDLAAHRGRSVVIAGDAQPPEVHALAHALNGALGNLGVTVSMAPSPIAFAGEPSHGLARLADALYAGEVDTLVVCGANIAYASPANRAISTLFGRARQSAYLGLFEDETAEASTFAIAQAHELESWGDARAFDGTISVIQPLIEPLFGGRTVLDVLALFAGWSDKSSYALVRSRFESELPRGTLPAAEVERRWRHVLKQGIVDGSASAPVTVSVDASMLADRLARAAGEHAEARDERGLELVVRADDRVYDGRFAQNAWLLELPTPIVKLTWTNAATLSAKTAAALGIDGGDEVELRAGDRAVKAVACVVPGQADGTVGLTLGWGRSRGAELAHERGANAYALLLDPSSAVITVKLRKTGKERDLPITQTHHELHGRDEDILHHGTLDAFRRRPRRERKRRLSLYEAPPRHASSQWGMTVDLARCTGCSACVIACQAENNVPTVGPDGVILNREMHWLRVDTYVVGAPEDARIAPQPMLCQHCEKAPCEYVCPVNATVHSPDGLNEMVYNRCVGTRFCSNNCPYKVRRFNWFNYHQNESEITQLAHNPDVTVRARGVMEKCTFCVQRIREHEILAKQGRAKGTPETACQEACPTHAIVFGDLLDRRSLVSRLQESDRAYDALGELGTEPRVKYLERVRNPNPELS